MSKTTRMVGNPHDQTFVNKRTLIEGNFGNPRDAATDASLEHQLQIMAMNLGRKAPCESRARQQMSERTGRENLALMRNIEGSNGAKSFFAGIMNIVIMATIIVLGILTYRATASWFVGKPVIFSNIIKPGYEAFPEIKKKTSARKR